MKYIYALYGRADIGKTSTIREVYNLLIEKFGKEIIVENDTSIFSEQGDIRVIVKIDSKIIGIESQGDPGSRLKVSLDIFVKMDCDIILCATRTRGTTIEWVKSLEPTYTINWIKKEYFDSDCKTKNKELASTIISKLLK